jgi:hypothetical protein
VDKSELAVGAVPQHESAEPFFAARADDGVDGREAQSRAVGVGVDVFLREGGNSGSWGKTRR